MGPVHVLNSSQSSQSSEDKFILTDGQKDHFTVTIRDISAKDDGVYLCGVERNGSDKRPSEGSITHISFIKEIELNVYSEFSFYLIKRKLTTLNKKITFLLTVNNLIKINN